MAEPDAFDPTRVLDGWRPPARASVPELALDTLLQPATREEPAPLLVRADSAGFDPTHLLDGWRPPAPAPLDLDLKSLLRGGTGPDPAKLARLKARGYEMLDVEDVELAERPAPRAVLAAAVAVEPLVPLPAEPDLEAPSAGDARDHLDLPLPDDSVWPLFTEESQVLDAGIGPEMQTLPVVEDGERPEPPDTAAVQEPEPLADVGPPAAVEAPVLDFHAGPPEPPRPLDDIELPPVAPPPAIVEAPVLEFRAEPPPEPDAQAVIDGIALPKVSPPPAVVDMPALDIANLAPPAPEPDPRLLAHWQEGAWTALARLAAGASAELALTPDGPRVQSHAPQWLCAVWPPQAQDMPLGRWPELASLVAAETMADALQQMLGELPGEAPLWSAALEADWDLVAELVLHQDTQLRPAQARALRELAEADRQNRVATFSDAYALQGRVARRCA